MEIFRIYVQSLFETTVPFLLAWEIYVFLMMVFFCLIVLRLTRIEKKINKLIKGGIHE
tara:strand:- start:396 stop:569 length:174 start_codon:yes stop_codon:yes gene_type:complete